MKKDLFTYDDENYFLGYYDEEMSWNGWCVPFFTKDVVQKIIKTVDKEYYRIEYDSKKDCFILYDLLYDDEEGKEVCESTILKNGLKVYAIGGMSWIWHPKYEDD